MLFSALSLSHPTSGVPRSQDEVDANATQDVSNAFASGGAAMLALSSVEMSLSKYAGRSPPPGADCVSIAINLDTHAV